MYIWRATSDVLRGALAKCAVRRAVRRDVAVALLDLSPVCPHALERAHIYSPTRF